MISLIRAAWQEEMRVPMFVGLSTDGYPDSNDPAIKNGARIYHMDTGKKYEYSKTDDDWYEVPSNGGSVAEIGKFLSVWNCTTGLPETNPQIMPYPYTTGDFYLIGTIGEINYKPNGTIYTGDASTVVDTRELKVNYMYFFDGTTWILLETVNPDLENYYTKNELNPRILPSVTTSDEGKIIRVNDEGEWAANYLPSETWTFTFDDDTTITKKIVVLE